MRTITCKCTNCGNEFEKALKEYTRRIKLSKPLFCSRSCSGINNLKIFGNKRNINPPPPRYGANPFNYYIRNCRKRAKEFNLALDYLQEEWNNKNGNCAYTKIPWVLNTHSIQHKDFRYTASLDRIDSSKGYVKGNVQFISTAINYMKSTMTHEQTIEFLHVISKNTS